MIQANIILRLIKKLKNVNVVVDVGAGSVHKYIKRIAEIYPSINFYLFDIEYKVPKMDVNNVHIRKADVSEEIPMKDHSSDITTAFGVLPFISTERGFKKATRAFKEMLRITRKGGYVVISSTIFVYYFNKGTLRKVRTKKILEKFGLKVESSPSMFSSAGDYICKKVGDIMVPGWILFQDKPRLAMKKFEEFKKG